MPREAGGQVRLLGAQAVGVVLVLGRHALQALRAPVVDAPAKAHFAHRRRLRGEALQTATALQRLPCRCLQRPRPRRERLPCSCLRLNVDPWRSAGCPKDKLSDQIESRSLVCGIR